MSNSATISTTQNNTPQQKDPHSSILDKAYSYASDNPKICSRNEDMFGGPLFKVSEILSRCLLAHKEIFTSLQSSTINLCIQNPELFVDATKSMMSTNLLEESRTHRFSSTQQANLIHSPTSKNLTILSPDARESLNDFFIENFKKYWVELGSEKQRNILTQTFSLNPPSIQVIY